MMGTVGLIIPAYNRAALLKEALESVLTQTRVPEQVIVVDDGSTDHTWEMLQGFGSPVVAIRQPNRGASAARNAGLARCTADFVCFLDSDDLLTSRSIEVRAGWLEAHLDCDCVYGRVRGVDMDGSPVPGREFATGPVSGSLFAALARYNRIPVMAYLLRRECLPPPPYFDETLKNLEDWDFLLRVVTHYSRLCWIDEVVSLYRHHAGMKLPLTGRLVSSALTIQDRVAEMAVFRALTPVQQARTHCSHAVARLGGGFPSEARRSLVRSVRAAPWYAPAYPLWTLTWLGVPASRAATRAVQGALRLIQNREVRG